MDTLTEHTRTLMARGVTIHSPHSVMIGPEVDLTRISGKGVVIYPGCRIQGAGTFIHDDCRIGYEAAASVEDCQLGQGVALDGGFFRKSTFLNGASAGSGSHVREGTLLEEYASIAHTVGLKQTILFPYVTLGSLINFCDCLMSGGTGPRHHSEVGSSYIHFNFTPNQDKATPSLIGDAPKGVMLNQNPIFLGGQGGLVGPTRLDYGTVIAAGSICRKDVEQPDRLVVVGGSRSGNVPHVPGVYRNVRRVARNNLFYIANLIALRQWYRFVRSLFIPDYMPEALHRGALDRVSAGIDERLGRFRDFCNRLEPSVRIIEQTSKENPPAGLISQHNQLIETLESVESEVDSLKEYEGDYGIRTVFTDAVNRHIDMKGPNYIDVIQSLPEEVTINGTRWMQGITDHFMTRMSKIIPVVLGTI